MTTRFGDIVLEVQRLSRRTDTAFQDIVKDAVRRKYQEILRYQDWPQLVWTDDFTIPAGVQYWGVPAQASKIISISDTTTEYGFDLAGRYSVFQQPSAAVTLNFQKATSDTSVQLRIEGYLSGVSVEETTTIGLVTSNSANTYDTVSEVTRVDSTSTGAVSIRESTTVIGRIPAGFDSWKYQWVKLPSSFTTAKDVSVKHVRALPPLTADNDVLALDCRDVVVAGANAECHRALREYQDAEREEYRFKMLLQDLAMDTFGQGELDVFVPRGSYR